MAKEKKLDWREMTFTELDYDALIEHALSLGGKRSVEAIAFLQKMEAEKVPFDDQMKEERRKVLEKKKKRKKDEKGEKFITLNEPLYTADEIEEILNKITEVSKYSFLQLKQEYCKEYYPSIIKHAKKKDEPTFAAKLAAAMEKAKEQAK